MALTSPPEGATYAEGATILLSADIDDADDCIDSVYFYSGETNLGAAQLFRLRPRHWLAQMNWNGVPRGTHVVTARVRQGGVFASQQRQIVVNPNTPPVVTIIAPTNESYVRGPISVMVTADAYDSDGSLTKVEFIADAVKIGELTTPSSGGYTYSLTWPDAPIGTHELTVRATDAIGASTSVSVRLHVVSNLPPQITITSPSSGTQYRAPRWVTGAFTMSDPDGSIANTQFFINGQLDWELPYPQSTFYFKATEPGTYTFAVAGTDDEGQTTLSAPIQITITPPCPPPQFAGVATVVADQSSMNVSWLAAEGTCQEYPVFYNVYRSVDPSFEPTDDSWWDCRISDTTFVDTYGLVPGVTYYYIVRAIHSDSMGCFRSSEDENVVRLSGRIEPPPALVGFVLTPTIVVGGAHAQATVTLDKPAPGGGAEIALQSPSPAAVVPSSVNIPEGGTTATFDVVTAPVDSITTVELTATYGAPLAASITIRAPQITSLAVAPTSVLGGQPSNATITLDGPAPSGFVVSMSASSAAVGVASAVTVPPDESEASVPLTTSTVAADNNVVITARRDGIERTATLTVHSETAPAPAITNLSLTPTNGVPGIANIAGTVTLSNAAPNPLDVTLQSSRTDLATVPASVHFTQGMTSASFPLTPIHGVAEATMVSVTATLSNTLSATVRLDPPIAESIEIAAEVPSGEQVPFVVHVTGFVVPNGSLVLTSSDPSVASPSTASENGTAYSGVLNTGIVNSATSIVLSVTSGGVTISKTITVSPCTLDPVSPSVPQGDTVWIEDSLPEWAFVDEGDPGTWDTSQHATGDASLKIGLSEWWRDSFVYFDSSNVEPPELGADQTFVSYVLINQCETAPRTLSIAIEKPVSQPCCGRRRPDSVYVLYWGDDVPLEEEGFVGTVATIRVGDVPPAGQWTRLELPLAMIYSGPVSWLDFRAYGGEVWWDHIGVSDVAAQARIGEAVLPESPQPAGVTLSWEIRALGGLPPIEYQFERLDGSTWTVVQPYGTSNIYMWTPGATDVGQHSIRASVRNSGSVAAFEDRRSYSFVVSSPP
ncbi:MAG TPA: Ig-like domain-containing protein [Thermoanaerobaculia bacterium]|nr:Ig-like domain-containing protein [Thermoanaerobaculia bacterium]